MKTHKQNYSTNYAQAIIHTDSAASRATIMLRCMSVGGYHPTERKTQRKQGDTCMPCHWRSTRRPWYRQPTRPTPQTVRPPMGIVDGTATPSLSHTHRLLSAVSSTLRPKQTNDHQISQIMPYPNPYKYRRPLTKYWDKYQALIRQGYSESEASRMAHNIPTIYG